MKVIYVSVYSVHMKTCREGIMLESCKPKGASERLTLVVISARKDTLFTIPEYITMLKQVES